MIEFLTYDLKVAVLLAVFYMFYRLMLARETFHRVNRIILLLTAVASFVLPLCVITIHETVTMQRAAQVAVGSFQVDMMDEEPATPLWQIVLPILFIIGMMVTLVHTLSSLFRIIRIIRHSERYPQTDGTTICVTGNASLTRGTCSSLTPSPPCNGLTLLCGCCALTLGPSMSMRPMQRYSLKASMRVNINTC